MVLTQKAIKKMKDTPVKRVDDNPALLHMSKEQVLAENAKMANIDLKTEQFKQKLLKEQKESELKDVKEEVAETKGGAPEISDETAQKIASLKKQIDEEGGPGSNHRKARLQKEIDELTK